MPGMGRSLQTGNSLIVSAFHTELLHQLLFILLVGALCAIGFNVVRTVQYRRLKQHGQRFVPDVPASSRRPNRPPGACSASASAASGSSTACSSCNRPCPWASRPA